MKWWLWLKAMLGCPSIVVFNDETFGVRRGLFMWRYLDLNDQKRWWFGLEYAYKYGSGTLEQAAIALATWQQQKAKGKGRGTPIVFK